MVSDDVAACAWGDQPDFDEPLTAEEAAESDVAWCAYLEGRDPGEPLAEGR